MSEKHYISENAQLMAEWNWERNTNFDPSQLTIGSGKKVWWKCSKGHEWEAACYSRIAGNQCPICSGRKVLVGYNDLSTLAPEIALQWHPSKNSDCTPKDVTINSHRKVWWLGPCGHEWQASIADRNNERGCPYCSSKKVLKGYNDLQTVNPTLATEWNYEKNNGLKPEDVMPNSGQKVWWKCIKGHEWQATIGSRNAGRGCPSCSGRSVIKGVNDLQTVNPTVANEWNYEKNNGLTPMDVMPNSNKKTWWKCDQGHEWQATINSRNNGIGCPYCSKRYAVKGVNDLQTVNPTLANEWHYEKNNGLTPMDVTPNSDKKVWWKCKKGHEWQATIGSRNAGRGCPICHSEQNTSFPEYAIVYYLKKYGLAVIHSYREKGYELDVYIPSKKVAIEYDGYLWHKNKTKQDLRKNYNCVKDGIKLYRIREGLPILNDSSIDYVVQRNQEDLSKILKILLSEITKTIIDVGLKRDAIAIENLREYTEKENSLLFANPEIAKEWNREKNGNLKPEHFAANSHKKVWWKCSKGHEWQATIKERNNGNGCPYCAGKKVLSGYNDLQTVNPTLAKEWNYEKNNRLTPMEVTPNSHLKVWWKCSQGHEWQASIADRNSGRGCPYCAGKKVLKGFNDLQTVNPTLAAEWHHEKNKGLTPADVTPNSHETVWWKCNEGHEWQAIIGNRHKGNGCPYCAGQKVLKGTNDLQTVNPILANEWNYERNNGLTPVDVSPNSNKKVWWKCSKGHEWQAIIQGRNKGAGCPFCSGRYAIKGVNDLQTVNPALAKEWNYERNNGLTPVDVMPNSDKKVWWKCENGHEWQAMIGNRHRGNGCPICRSKSSKRNNN